MNEVMADPDWWKLGLDVIWKIGVSILAVWTVVTSRSKANKNAINAVEAKLEGKIANVDTKLAGKIEVVDAKADTLQINVTKLRADVKHLPNDGDIARVHSRIDNVAQGMTKIEGTLEQMNSGLNRIHDYLLSQSKGKD